VETETGAALDCQSPNSLDLLKSMEGSRRQSQAQEAGRGRSAESPVHIPKRGWRDILMRVKGRIGKDNLSIIAGGTAFFVLLGVVPALAAFISIYGLVANPSDIQAQFAALSQVMPNEARTILEQQMTRISSEQKTAGIAAIVGIALALWGASAAMKSVINALNIIYREEEKRSYVKLTLTALGLTTVFIVVGLIAIGLIVVLPPILQHVGLGSVAKGAAWLLRWPLLLGVALLGLAILYRFGPSRENPRWQWITPGALVATGLWVASSILFSLYVQYFGSYNKTYGSLAAVVVLMMWLYISAFALLLGTEINAEAEHQTEKDTTTGEPRQPGRRGAYVADTLGGEES
jgi:membrane protein